ncbi:glycosyl hydrolase family 28-related protein [Flavivirga amylovorans]|uniref:Glycosyl hydrolase family 28-related protein n=1 Tax=Flavivirga amylovorans TaxID=870486 RepID=A0ABT8WXF8_9FLAO|nr:glycosyl hydrolase family 28-related protein [Flavivirga amylovorans]MDO5986182.1 glycosyl hydrolase family 28-related protein [Flavivirga amylovorans]
MKNIITIVLVALTLFNCKAQDIDEKQFYIATNKLSNKTVDLVKDYKANAKGEKDDSNKLQKAIDDLTKLKRGGTIIIPEGKYKLISVNLKSNVHIKIDKGAVLIPRLGGKKTNIFSLGEKEKPSVVNVSVSCSQKGQMYTVDFSNVVGSAALFSIGNTRNFLLSDFKVKDNYTKFSAVRMGIDLYNGKYYHPTNGVIKNATTINSHYGYGLIQAQCGENVLFKDLSGIGGATLRLETGAKKVNDVQATGLDGIVARNISCKDGNSAVMLSPHALQNGTVDIDGVTVENTGFGVRIEGGFIAKKYDKSKVSKKGAFKHIKVNNVKATYGNTAQLKSKHFKFIPCELVSQIKEAPKDTYAIGGESSRAIYLAPAVVAVLDTHEFPTEVSNVEAIGFVTPAVIKEEDVHDCDLNLQKEKKKTDKKEKKGKKKKNKKKKNKKEKVEEEQED